MYRGFPVGYLLFWGENAQSNGGRQIGVDAKQRGVASRLIVDGQQRLTSLYAVFRGRKVLDEDYRERSIDIAFRPRDGAFEVADAAIRKDPEWIPNISALWASGKSSYQMVKGFLHSLSEKTALTASSIRWPTRPLLEWPENIAISDAPPTEYVPEIRKRFSNADWVAMHDLHALPDGWELMEYPVFLEERRNLMAGVIRRGFETLR